MGIGVLGQLVAAVSSHALRVVGGVAVMLSAGVASVSVTTEHGLAVTADAAERSATVAADGATMAAFVEFATFHPAYPVATALGLVLLILGDDAPLVG